MTSFPSFNNIFEGPQECCGFLVERIFHGIARKFLSVNKGTIDFAPAVASWIFILAVVNATFPRALPRLASSWWMALALRLLTPYFAFRYVWIPANRILFYFLKRRIGLSEDLLNQVYLVVLPHVLAFAYDTIYSQAFKLI